MGIVNSRFHFVGIGGIGMCGLAELLFRMGAFVTGSDQADNANTARLKKLGIKVMQGHSSENVEGSDVVVYSSAVTSANPEILRAKELRIPLIPRAEALAEIMRLKRGIAVAGTHGKTTTTAMTSSILLAAGKEPTIVVGGRLDMINSTALWGKGDWLVAEADESDGSFHKLVPEIAIITNIDNDHLDHYGSMEILEKAFSDFGLKVPFYGALVVCGDDARIKKIFSGFPKTVFTYGFSKDNDFVLKGEKGQYEIWQEGKLLGSLNLSVPGRHNILNATAAIIASLKTGISFQQCVEGLKHYSGVDRRFQKKGETKDVMVYDDYGHHPTEVKATLQAFKEKFPDRRLVVYFQPHRYSRTEICWNEFADCFSGADHLLLADIYPAGEVPRPGINSERLLGTLKVASKVYFPKLSETEMVDKIKGLLKPQDIFLTLGAGDGWKLGEALLKTM